MTIITYRPVQKSQSGSLCKPDYSWLVLLLFGQSFTFSGLGCGVPLASGFPVLYCVRERL